MKTTTENENKKYIEKTFFDNRKKFIISLTPSLMDLTILLTLSSHNSFPIFCFKFADYIYFSNIKGYFTAHTDFSEITFLLHQKERKEKNYES